MVLEALVKNQEVEYGRPYHGDSGRRVAQS